MEAELLLAVVAVIAFVIVPFVGMATLFATAVFFERGWHAASGWCHHAVDSFWRHHGHPAT
jgi:hypothetical protein